MADLSEATADPGTLLGRSAGIGWSMAANLVDRGAFVAFSLMLMSLLPPRDFGLFGTVAVFTGMAGLVGDFGLSSALIQRREATDAHFDTAFWTNLLVGTLLTALMAAGAPLLARAYGEPELARVALALAPLFVVGAIMQVQIARLRRRLEIRKLAAVQLAATVFSGLAGLWAAHAGWGVASLVVQSLGGSTLSATGLWLVGRWRPRWRISRTALREMAGFGTQVVAFAVIAYALRSVDRLLVGRFIGLAPLGIYAKSYDLIALMLSVVSAGVGRVLMPTLARLQHDQPEAGRVYLQAVRSVAMVTFPAMVGLCVVAESFVRVLFGPAWLPMIPLLRILTGVGLIESIGALNGNVYLSHGRAGLQLKVGLVFGAAGLSAVCTGLPWGIGGVVWAYAGYAALAFYPSLRIATGIIGLTFSDVVRAVRPTLLYSLAMGAVVWWLDTILGHAIADGARLAVLVVAGALTYFALTHGKSLWAAGSRRMIASSAQKRR